MFCPIGQPSGCPYENRDSNRSPRKCRPVRPGREGDLMHDRIRWLASRGVLRYTPTKNMPTITIGAELALRASLVVQTEARRHRRTLKRSGYDEKKSTKGLFALSRLTGFSHSRPVSTGGECAQNHAIVSDDDLGKTRPSMRAFLLPLYHQLCSRAKSC